MAASEKAKRLWYFEVCDDGGLGGRIYLMRESLAGTSGREFGVVKSITSCDKKRGSNFLLVNLETQKGTVSITNFNYQRNKFCIQFRGISTATTFVLKFNKMTIFDKIHQICRAKVDIARTHEEPSTPSTAEHDKTIEVNTDDHEFESFDSLADDEELQPVQKKAKIVVNESISDTVESQHIGLFQLPLTALEKPPDNRLLRNIDSYFVETLTERLKHDSSGIGIPPFAVVCNNISTPDKFVKCTNSRSWETAQSSFPNFTKGLNQFISLPFKNGVPESFRLYCQAAINAKNGIPESSNCWKIGDYYISLIQGSILSVSKDVIQERTPQYAAAQLILLNLQKDMSFQQIAYNTRELNASFTSVNSFLLIPHCALDDLQSAQQSFEVCYDKVEIGYSYNKKAVRKASNNQVLLVPAMKGVLVAQWFQESNEFSQLAQHNCFIYSDEDADYDDKMSPSLKKVIIENLTADGQTIIDATNSCPLTICNINRNIITIYEDETIKEKVLTYECKELC